MQLELMCNWFADKDHRVSIITWSESEFAVHPNINVEIVNLRQTSMSWEIWLSLTRPMMRIKADVYLQNQAESAMGVAALWCRLNRNLASALELNQHD